MLENAKSCIVYGHYKKSLLCLKEFKGRIIYLRTSFVNWCYMIHIHTYMVNLTIWNQSHKKKTAKQRKFPEMHFFIKPKKIFKQKNIFKLLDSHICVANILCFMCSKSKSKWLPEAHLARNDCVQLFSLRKIK